VAVFKLADGGQRRAAPALHAALSSASRPTAERRSPGRAKNVTRPSFGAKKAGPKAAAPAVETASAKTGTDDEWTSF